MSSSILKWICPPPETLEEPPEEDGKVEWFRCLPYVLIHLACIIAFFFPVTWPCICIAFVSYLARMFSITAFYHRYFSHRSFKTKASLMFNSAVAALNAPPVSTVLDWKSSYDDTKGPLIDMSQAVPGYAAHDDILASLAVAAADPTLARYGPVEGDPEFRTTYANHVGQIYDAKIMADEVQVTSGCNQAFVAAVLAIAGHGDSIVMMRPCYFNHESALNMLGIGIDYVDCDADADLLPKLSDIDASIKPTTRAVALVSPNNPTGSIYPAELLDDILTLCQRHGIWLIIDETYRDFLPLNMSLPHRLFARDNWQSNLIQLYSFSKSYCLPGHRLGAIIAGREVISQLAKIIDNIQICAPRIVQKALTPMLASMAKWRQKNRVDSGIRSRR